MKYHVLILNDQSYFEIGRYGSLEEALANAPDGAQIEARDGSVSTIIQ